jgi:ATP-binding cassette subfamily F protein uup
VTSTLVFEGEGVVKEYVGGYDDWQRQRSPAAAAAAPRAESPRSESPRAEAPRAERARPRKLSYKDERELEVLPQRIESLEAELQELHQTLADPAFYQQGGSAIAQAKARLEALETELQAAYARWETLESGKG